MATNLLGDEVAPKAPPAADSDADKKDPRRIVHRWIEGGAEWGLRADGHYTVIRSGQLAPGVSVWPKFPMQRRRKGSVLALIPGTGPYPRPFFVLVNWGAPFIKPDWRPAEGSKIKGPKPVIRLNYPEDVAVVI